MQNYSFTNQEILTILTDHGVKPSAQRIAILRQLMENRIHPTVDEIYNALLPTNPTLSRTTVYNTLRLLTNQGIIRCIDGGGPEGSRWDYATDDHAHFVCATCGRISDFEFAADPSSFTIGREGYLVRSADLILKGLCPSCSHSAASAE